MKQWKQSVPHVWHSSNPVGRLLHDFIKSMIIHWVGIPMYVRPTGPKLLVISTSLIWVSWSTLLRHETLLAILQVSKWHIQEIYTDLYSLETFHNNSDRVVSKLPEGWLHTLKVFQIIFSTLLYGDTHALCCSNYANMMRDLIIMFQISSTNLHMVGSPQLSWFVRLKC